ncbi:fungal pheromone STE3G-protein-coupled receptor [Neolentinus lepideus HHB14362 ss-1]|uniref:Fungal pheromone STE3G-protein-coupled receptor n=1 Tax=Neolentinus lepideus HHB14362 ss-1 TaxID=1314782 RepID=A0A165NFU0_9AGAM|nr:fungal pheromone STE3G-protein-coupled receptor [Neolentinus lepideus HHB14362 ss-1]
MAPFPHPELPVGAFLAAFLVLFPLPWHWRARNIATIAIMLWLFVINVVNAVNSIVWAGNIIIRIPVWCDITTKIYIGASYALPAATTCICKHLELVSSSRNARLDHRDRVRRMIFDSCMCFGLPVVFMILHYVVQGHRFDIIENIGCQPAIYNSIAAIFILYFPPLLLSTITLIYAAMALTHFIRRRIDFGKHLQNNGSALTSNRYIRLIAMSVVEMVLGTSINAFNVYSNVSVGLRPYTSWADVHSNFSRIGQWPSVFLTPSIRRDEMVIWWALPVSSYIFFLFFGLGEEAFKEYGKVIRWVRRVVLRRKVSEKPSSSMRATSRR